MKPKLRLLLLLALGSTISATDAVDFTVTATNSSGPGSLYQAITDANNTPGADSIVFNIPGPGVHKIDVGKNPLPTITDSLTIDGYSQPGAKPNTLKVGDDAVILVQIDGGTGQDRSGGLGFVNGDAPSDYTVRGLCLTGFSTAITAGTVNSLVITGNFIGLLPDGETSGRSKIGVSCPNNVVIGGRDPVSRNIISGRRRCVRWRGSRGLYRHECGWHEGCPKRNCN